MGPTLNSQDVVILLLLQTSGFLIFRGESMVRKGLTVKVCKDSQGSSVFKSRCTYWQVLLHGKHRSKCPFLMVLILTDSQAKLSPPVLRWSTTVKDEMIPPVASKSI